MGHRREIEPAQCLTGGVGGALVFPPPQGQAGNAEMGLRVVGVDRQGAAVDHLRLGQATQPAQEVGRLEQDRRTDGLRRAETLEDLERGQQALLGGERLSLEQIGDRRVIALEPLRFLELFTLVGLEQELARLVGLRVRVELVLKLLGRIPSGRPSHRWRLSSPHSVVSPGREIRPSARVRP